MGDKGVLYIDGFQLSEVPKISDSLIAENEDLREFPKISESSEITFDLDIGEMNFHKLLVKLSNYPISCYGRQPYSIKCKKCEYVNDCIKQKINNRWNGKRV